MSGEYYAPLIDLIIFGVVMFVFIGLMALAFVKLMKWFLKKKKLKKHKLL